MLSEVAVDEDADVGLGACLPRLDCCYVAAFGNGQSRVLHGRLSGSCGRDSPTALAMTPGVGDRQLRDGERRFGSGRISIVALDGGRRAAVVTERFGQRLQ
jgi:hypothetical protein